MTLGAAEQALAPRALGPDPAPSASLARAPGLSFETVYEQHFDFIWRALRCFGLTPPALEDAVQDVLLTAYRRLGTFEYRSSVRTWLFGIAYRVALNYRRHQRRKGRLDELSEDVPALGAGPDQQVEEAQALRFVELFLDTLDDERRAVFLLCEIEQMAAPEAATALGVKLNTIYSRLRLARRDFRRALKAQRRRA
jgi:RNA polymerase sigma-70 factor, ECF subfamily